MGDRALLTPFVDRLYRDNVTALKAIWRRRTWHHLTIAPLLADKATGFSAFIDRLEPGHAPRAQNMYRGHFCFGSESVVLGHDQVFNWQTTNQAAIKSRDGLSWLGDFAASNKKLHNGLARHLLAQWSKTKHYHQDLSVSTAALLALSLSGPTIWSGATQIEKCQLFQIVSEQAAIVAHRHSNSAAIMLDQGIALLTAATVFAGLPSHFTLGSALIDRSIDQVVLGDGGHISRNPAALIALLQIFLPLRQALTKDRKVVPIKLHHAIERMLPMLRMMCHGDGGFAAFQGASVETDRIAALLLWDDVKGKPLTLAPDVGYARLNSGNAVLLGDGAGQSHYSSPLAIEFSEGKHRILSNCGTPQWGNKSWQDGAHSAAAHNTVSPVVGIRTHQKSIPSDIQPTAEGDVLRMAMSYDTAFNHQRTCFLARNGYDLRVSDTLTGPDTPFIFRLHFHPDVKVSTIKNGTELIIALPNRSVWRFLLRGGAMRLEESVYMAEAAGPRRTTQVVIDGVASTTGHTINWSLKKQRKPQKSKEGQGLVGDAPEFVFG